MELLDLGKHDPEDYAGKMIRAHGAEYVVGPHLGTGAERIVHRLVNRQSGLSMLVVKIPRQPRPKGLYTSLLARARRDPALAKVITITHEVDIPGGMVELQDDLGNRPPQDDPYVRDIDAGLAALRRQDYGAAAICFERVLAAHPAHTMALINLAAVVNAQGDTARAMSLAGEAVDIEPNVFLYRRALMQHTANAGLPRAALEDFSQTLKVFPHVHDLHETALGLYLHCGEPESAQALLADAIVDDARRAELAEEIARDRAAKAQAAECLAAARAHVEGNDIEAAREALERGNALYNKDRVLNVNYALVLGRTGEPGLAAGVLLEAAVAGPPWWTALCWANAAYCLVEAGDPEGALSALTQLASHLRRLHGGTMPNNPADLPGVAIWVGSDDCIEEPLHSAAERIEAAVAAVANREPVPSSVRELTDAMRVARLRS